MAQRLRAETEQLQASNALLERYAHLSSHDLRTPLRGVCDTVEELTEHLQTTHLEAAQDEMTQACLLQVSSLIERMENLIDGMLHFHELGVRPLRPERINMRTELLRLIAHLSLHSRTRLVMQGAEEICSDRSLFSLILENLLRNAIQHHPNPTLALVTVSVRSFVHGVEISVSDNGNGIDPCYRDRIFDLFESLDDKGPVESVGLGLAMTKRALTLLGGHISVRSSDDGGAKFTIVLNNAAVPETSSDRRT